MTGFRATIAVLLLAMSACGRAERPTERTDAARSVADGRAYSVALLDAQRRGSLTDPQVVALGYVERVRLGIGSPYRAMGFALNDPRLPDSVRIRTARAMLARTYDGQAYVIDPSALDRIGPRAMPRPPGLGRRHYGLIEDAVVEAPDPRSGELAVRLAYALAAAEQSVGGRATTLAAQTAALVRDRELARQDARRLLQQASQLGVEPVLLVARWRRSRLLEVERPPLQELAPAAERAAMELAPRLSAAIRGLVPGAATAGLLSETDRPLLLASTARRLVALADSLDAPPQTPIVLALETHRVDLLSRPDLSAEAMAARLRMIEHGWNEERLVAEHAVLMSGPGAAGSSPAAVALAAAAGFRGYAQEEVWFPGSGGPTATELEAKYGLVSVTFDDSVSPAWRPYYRRMLDGSLGDLQRVLPALSVRGLSVHFGASPRGEGTLALHDPKRRRVYLPPRTGAGTIAHEIAHDLDWQVAQRFYGVRGDYGTDRAQRRGGRGSLSRAVATLTEASLTADVRNRHEPEAHWRRPAEIFARQVDWYVAVSLARSGRMNGYLTSVQDDVMTGYGTVAPPDVSGTAGAALVTLLDEVAPLYPEARSWFLNSYGRARSLTAYDLARRVLESPIPAEQTAEAVRVAARRWPVLPVTPDDSAHASGTPYALGMDGVTMPAFQAVEDARDAALATVEEWVCRSPGAAYDPQAESARRQLVAEAARARARGVAIDLAERVTGVAARRYVARQFFGGPWPVVNVDSATAWHLTPLVERARIFGGAPPVPLPGQSFRVLGTGDRCSEHILRTTR